MYALRTDKTKQGLTLICILISNQDVNSENLGIHGVAQGSFGSSGESYSWVVMKLCTCTFSICPVGHDFSPIGAHQSPKNVFVGELCGVYCKQGVKELWSRHFASLTHWGREKNGRHFADGILERICLNENASILIQISLTIVPKGPIN